jgi:hypothetical protein
MASLETLWLGRIMDPRPELQQLMWSCPCLVNLTLEGIPHHHRDGRDQRSLADLDHDMLPQRHC